MRRPAPATVIERFDPDRHDRTAFSCGIERVDNFFKKTAGKLSRADNLRVFVLSTIEGDLIGFHALNVHSIDYAELPARYARTRPAHGAVPAVYISMIAVDERFQGQGFGGDLLADALTRIVRVGGEVGVALAVLDVLDCGDPERVEKRETLYRGYGFMPLASDPLRLFMPLARIRDFVATAQADTPP